MNQRCHLYRVSRLWLYLFVSLLYVPVAGADIGVALADPTTVGTSIWTHAGHSLVYLSNVCAETPVRARLCRPGERGSILTAYPALRENRNYHWNLVPLDLYLYGSLSATDAPQEDRLLYSSRLSHTALEAYARDRAFAPVCPAAGDCPDRAHSYWRDLVAATVDRDIFIYAVRTTPQQDQDAVDWLNHDANANHYNYLTDNCANFTQTFVDAIFPHSVHRDFINDLAMMGPKAAAHSFTRWALKHPELGFYSVHYAQTPGELPRATPARSGTETAIHTKKYLIPAALIGDHEVAGSFFVAYLLTGRFGLYKTYTRYPSPEIVSLEEQAREVDDTQAKDLRLEARRQRDAILGSSAEWSAYRTRFSEIAASTEARELTNTHKHPFPPQYEAATAIVDRDGNPWLVFTSGGTSRRVGISSRNVLAKDSDPALAFQLMLGRVAYELKAKNHLRETMQEFCADWSLLELAEARLHSVQPVNLTAALDAATP